MIRTQIRLDEQGYELEKTAASALSIPVAEFVRRAIRDALPAQGSGPWMKYAGFVQTGDRRSSQFIGELIYGRKV